MNVGVLLRQEHGLDSRQEFENMHRVKCYNHGGRMRTEDLASAELQHT